MKYIRSARAGMGLPTMLAIILPVIIFVGALALSSQSSLARRGTITLWASYVAMDLAESAIDEAAHELELEDVFDPQVFKPIYDNTAPPTRTFPQVLLDEMVENYVNPVLPNLLTGIPGLTPEYRSIVRTGSGSEVYKMLVAFQFPDSGWRTVRVPGLVKQIATSFPEVSIERDDLAVLVKPLSFRREFYFDPNGSPDTWVNWGVVQFRVRVRTREGTGKLVLREIRADRRFSLPIPDNPPKPDAEVFAISTVNLRVHVIRVE